MRGPVAPRRARSARGPVAPRRARSARGPMAPRRVRPMRGPVSPRSPEAALRRRTPPAKRRPGPRSEGPEFAWGSPCSSDFVRQRALLPLPEDVHRHPLLVFQVLDDGVHLLGGGEIHPVHLLKDVPSLESETVERGARADGGDAIAGRPVPLEIRDQSDLGHELVEVVGQLRDPGFVDGVPVVRQAGHADIAGRSYRGCLGRRPPGRGRGRRLRGPHAASDGEQVEFLPFLPSRDPHLVPLDGREERARFHLLILPERFRLLHSVGPKDRPADGRGRGDDGPHQDEGCARRLGLPLPARRGKAGRQLHPLPGGEEIVPLLRRRRGDGPLGRGGGGPRDGLRGVRAHAEIPRQGDAEGNGGHDDGNSKHGEVNRFSHPLPGKWFTNNHFGRITGIPSTTGRYPVNHGSLRRRRFAAKGFSSPLLTRSLRNAYDGRTGDPMTEPTTGPQGLNVQESLDFLREIVRRDTRSGVYGGRFVTRFPPEPNGFLHIGHAKSICINFGIARDFGGICHLRFDDTNPETEDMKYVESIMRDVRWLGFDWKDKLFFASDYYEQLYDLAVRLIKDAKAYVDSQSDEEIRKARGTITEPGIGSPYRSRPVAENLDLFSRMRAGDFPDGAHVLRAKIDMASRNMKMRDPLLYRIRHATHYRRGDAWCIYPMYDFAHPLSDAIEGITHSICTLEFENNRAIYDWLVDNLFREPRPRQYEFARLNLDYTVMSKRKLLQLVEEKLVSGWDDPRMPTIAGMRRRGYTPEGIRLFASPIRDDLNARAPRAMAVLRPLKVTITNWPDDRVEWPQVPSWPRDIGKEGSRKVPLPREVRIERTDFSVDPPADSRRMRPGGEARLMGAYFIRCDEVLRDPSSGKVTELLCSYDPESLGAPAKGERKKTTAIQWVSASHAIPAEVRLYDRLFTVADPENMEEGRSFKEFLAPASMEVD